MAGATLDYRLRIRNDDNSADLLVYSTLPALNCFTLKPPAAGDGQSFDPITGTFVLGSYTYDVVDAPTDLAGTRAVSSYMADANNRYQLISHIAIVEFSADRGVTWTGYLSGFVNQVQKLSALVYEFTIGDAQRVEQNFTLFKEKSGSFDKMSCLIGGPVRGGFAQIADYGPWTMTTKSFYAGLVVQFHFVNGYVRRSTDNFFFSFPTGGFQYVEGDYTSYEEKKVNELAKPYRVEVPDYHAAGIGFTYPRLEARVEDENGNLIGLFTPLNSRDPAYVVGTGWTAGDLQALLTGGDLCLYWPSSGTNPATGAAWPAQPSLHQNVRICVYALDVTDKTPVHYSGHPIDVHTMAYDDAGIVYDAASVTSTKAAIGDNLTIAGRATASVSLEEFANNLQGIFGYSVRQSQGVRYFFPTRIRSSSVPTIVCTANDLSDPTQVIFDQDEKSIINKVTLNTQRFELWAPESFGKDSERPIDDIVNTPLTVSVQTDDTAVYNIHEVTFSIEAELLMAGLADFKLIQFFTPQPLSSQDFLLGFVDGAGGVFDRRRRGAIVGNLAVIRGTVNGVDAAQLGDEIVLDIPWQQNANGIGGRRIVQVTQRTETPTGPILVVEDAGTEESSTDPSAPTPAPLPHFYFVHDPTFVA